MCEPQPLLLHVSNNEEMAFNYTEVIVYRSFTHPRGALQRFHWQKTLNLKPFGTKIKVNMCANFVLDCLKNSKKKKMKKLGF